MNPLALELQRRGLDWLIPDWPTPPGVRALMTTRNGLAGAAMDVSTRQPGDPFAQSGRALLQDIVGAPIAWLDQVHGREVLRPVSPPPGGGPLPQADACILTAPGLAAAVQTADCLPVLLCSLDGSVVAAAHAGWRGLAAGVLEATLAGMGVAGGGAIAWLGPAIGPTAFEVGDEVRQAFCDLDWRASEHFQAGGPGKWYGDLYALARLRLRGAGVTAVFGGSGCTLGEPERFYSFRRGAEAGRMASVIWRVA